MIKEHVTILQLPATSGSDFWIFESRRGQGCDNTACTNEFFFKQTLNRRIAANKSSRAPLIDEYCSRRQITRLRWRSSSCSREKGETSSVASSLFVPPFDPALGGSRASILPFCRDHIGSTTFVRCLRSNKFSNSAPAAEPIVRYFANELSCRTEIVYRSANCDCRTNERCKQSPESPCVLIFLLPRALLFRHSPFRRVSIQLWTIIANFISDF